MNDPLEWYFDIPVISRTYLTASFVTTAACALDLVSPFSLYYNFNLIFRNGEVWRLLTNFFFFGKFSLEFIFHMYFLMRYCRLLEENSFRGRTADFVFMLFLSALFMTVRLRWGWRKEECVGGGGGSEKREKTTEGEQMRFAAFAALAPRSALLSSFKVLFFFFL
jgi:hypothetical protein